MRWANFLNIYQPHDSIVATAHRWQESGQARGLREAYLHEHPRVDAKRLIFS